MNQPTTAMQVIDRVEDILRRVVATPPLAGYYADAAGRARLVEPVMTWDDLLDLAFTEITSYGASSAQVVRRLLAAYGGIASQLEPAMRPGLQARQAALLQRAAATGIAPAELRPDPLGLGLWTRAGWRACSPS